MKFGIKTESLCNINLRASIPILKKGSVIEIEDLQEKLRKVNLQVIKLQSEKQELLAMNKELQRKIEVMKLQ